MVENKSIETKNHAVTFYQNVEYVFSHLRMDEYQTLTKTLGSHQKIADFIKKNAKIRDIKMFKTIPLLLETIQCPINKAGSWKNWKNDEKFQKPEKKCKFCQKLQKIVIFKSWNLFHGSSKFFSNLFSNPWWGFRAPGTQILKQLE